MGVYRLVLSLFVVVYHFGVLSPNAVRASVYAFFVLSGALMALVLDRSYGRRPLGTVRFYANRSLRLAPLLLLYAAATYVAAAVVTPEATTILPHVRSSVFATADARVWPPLFRALPSFSPQTWSLVNEGLFYALAPLLALLWMRVRVLFVAVFVASAALNVWEVVSGGAVEATGARYDLFVYQNFFANLAFFMLGMVVYYFCRRGHALAGEPYVALALLVVVIEAFRHPWRLNPLYVTAAHPVSTATVAGIYLLLVPVVALTALLVRIDVWPRRVARIERLAGNVAYGVFVNQFLAAIAVLALARRLAAGSSMAQPHSRAFAGTVCVVAVLLAALTYRVLDKPLEGLRRRVRGGKERT